jgi:two-component sensor histidine kinase
VEKAGSDDLGHGVLVMKWQEVNGPRVTAPRRRGFGRIMLERVLATQFGGATEIAWLAEGMVFTARLPLMEIESEAVSVDSFAQALSG